MKVFKFLKWYLWDLRHPKKPRPQGILCFCSDAGTGKTISVIEHLDHMKVKFPDCKIYTNVQYKGQDGEINCIADMEGKEDCFFFLDEVNVILDSHDWKNVNPYFKFILSQHRHLGIQLITTAQSYDHINKKFRDFCTTVIEVENFKTRWFFQKAFKRESYKQIIKQNFITKENEFVDEWKAKRAIWRYSFIASNELFEKYSTYKIVDNLTN